jgi:two-component sensor histidine kinase
MPTQPKSADSKSCNKPLGIPSHPVSVRDDGIGLPPDFDLSTSTGLGMRIVTALAKQLGTDRQGGELATRS